MHAEVAEIRRTDNTAKDQMRDDRKFKSNKGGSSCHQCKSRRNFAALTYCTSNLDNKNKKCRKKFCGHCLKKFYKESLAPEDKPAWRCPSCRKICCCAACRRRKQRGDGDSPLDDDDDSPPHHQSGGHDHQLSMALKDVDERRRGLANRDHLSFLSGAKFDVFAPIIDPNRKRTYFEAGMDDETKHVWAQVKHRAQHSLERGSLDDFAMAYQFAHSPMIKPRVHQLVSRPDISKPDKAETIAELLRAGLMSAQMFYSNPFANFSAMMGMGNSPAGGTNRTESGITPSVFGSPPGSSKPVFDESANPFLTGAPPSQSPLLPSLASLLSQPQQSNRYTSRIASNAQNTEENGSGSPHSPSLVRKPLAQRGFMPVQRHPPLSA